MEPSGSLSLTYILADGNAAHTVLLAELLTQWRLKVVRTCPSAMFQVSSYAHDDPTHTTRRTEVCLSRFAARARDDCLGLGHCCCEYGRVVEVGERKFVSRIANIVVRQSVCGGPARLVFPTASLVREPSPVADNAP